MRKWPMLKTSEQLFCDLGFRKRILLPIPIYPKYYSMQKKLHVLWWCTHQWAHSYTIFVIDTHSALAVDSDFICNEIWRSKKIKTKFPQQNYSNSCIESIPEMIGIISNALFEYLFYAKWKSKWIRHSIRYCIRLKYSPECGYRSTRRKNLNHCY